MHSDSDVAATKALFELGSRMKREAEETGKTQVGDPRTGRIESAKFSRRPFLEAELVSSFAASHGNWIRQRGVSRERRSQATQKARGTRAGPRSSDDPSPVEPVRGFAAASTRMVVHLERRRAAMRLA